MIRKSSVHGVNAVINEHRRELTPDGIPPSMMLNEWIHDMRFELERTVALCENEKRWHILRAIALGVMCLEEYGVPDEVPHA